MTNLNNGFVIQIKIYPFSSFDGHQTRLMTVRRDRLREEGLLPAPRLCVSKERSYLASLKEYTFVMDFILRVKIRRDMAASTSAIDRDIRIIPIMSTIIPL